MLTLKERIPHTALTEATLVGKRLHSRFGLTGLTGLTLSDGAGHDLFAGRYPHNTQNTWYLWNTTVKKAPGAFDSLLRFRCAQRSKQVHLPLKAPKGEGDDTPSSVQFQEERLKRQKMSWQHAWPQDAIAIGINLVRLKSWACLFLISIPRFSVTFFPFQFVGQLRFLLPVPCLPGSLWNWHFLRNNQPA